MGGGGTTGTFPTEIIRNGRMTGMNAYIIKNGTVNDSGTWQYSSDGNISATLNFAIPIDVTNATTLHIDGNVQGYYSNNKTPLCCINDDALLTTTGSSSGNTNTGTFVMLASSSSSSLVSFSKTIDVSNKTGIYYVGLATAGTGSYNGIIQVNNLYLE